jgi:pantoate--beta-alanine ligase
VRPKAAVFGRKDGQQLAIIQRMVRDLNFPVEIIPLDTVREPDGLALSSRNVYLNAEERAQAPALRRALLMASARARAGERDAETLCSLAANELAESAPLGKVDYIELSDAENLQPLVRLGSRAALLALAVKFGPTRLIDNISIESGI